MLICLGSRADDKATLLYLVTKDLTARYHAGDIIKTIAPLVGGAAAGGPQPEHIEQALAKLEELL